MNITCSVKFFNLWIRTNFILWLFIWKLLLFYFFIKNTYIFFIFVYLFVSFYQFCNQSLLIAGFVRQYLSMRWTISVYHLWVYLCFNLIFYLHNLRVLWWDLFKDLLFIVRWVFSYSFIRAVQWALYQAQIVHEQVSWRKAREYFKQSSKTFNDLLGFSSFCFSLMIFQK